jgi:hypothetical protein
MCYHPMTRSGLPRLSYAFVGVSVHLQNNSRSIERICQLSMFCSTHSTISVFKWCLNRTILQQCAGHDAYLFNYAGPPTKVRLTKSQRTLSLVITSYHMHAPAQMFQISKFRTVRKRYALRAGQFSCTNTMYRCKVTFGGQERTFPELRSFAESTVPLAGG